MPRVEALNMQVTKWAHALSATLCAVVHPYKQFIHVQMEHLCGTIFFQTSSRVVCHSAMK